MLYKCEEWQGGSGLWYCGHTASFPRDVQMWIVPARILGMEPAEFLKFLFAKFEPDHVYHNEDCSFVGWAWSSQVKMRAFKNFINAEARKKNFQI